MEFKEIKKIRVQHNENYEMLPVSIQDPNYTQYTAYLERNLVMVELIDKIIQNYTKHTLQKINETSYYLYLENYQIKIEIFDSFIKISIDESTYTAIFFKSTISTYKVLCSLYQLIHIFVTKNKKQEFRQEMKQLIQNHEDFEFCWYNDDSNSENEVYLNYKPIDISILCKYDSNSIKFISYMHGEGEIYYSGDEKLTTFEIQQEIKYYQRLLAEQPVIEEQLSKIKI